MKTKRQTKEAAHAANGKRAAWRTVTRDGKRALLSPEGEVYYGTPAEVNEAALMPDRRRALAESLRVARLVCRTRDELRESCAERRREKIMLWKDFDRTHRPAVTLPPALHVLLGACARYWGDTVEYTLADIVATDLRASIEDAKGEGLPTLPLTRHEQAALRALGFDTARLAGEDYELALREIAEGVE